VGNNFFNNFFTENFVDKEKNKYLCDINSARIGYVSMPTLKKGKRGRGLCLRDLALFIIKKRAFSYKKVSDK